MYAVKAGPVWLLLRESHDDGLVRRILMASSPDPRAIEAASRLLGERSS